jgi:serine/threonine protein kinase
MEYCEGGELLEKIMEGSMDEKVAKRIFAEIVAAIYYCHQRKICHRDLKP